jgi:MSHA biogenesis protein MshO
MIMRGRRQRGFTLVELVVALTLATIVVGFAGMLLTAPMHQFEVQTQRAELVEAATDGWPQLREDLRTALPNSARARRNGAVVVLEMLAAVDWVRYQSLPAAGFTTSGRFRGIAVPFSSSAYFLSVNNMGTGVPGLDAYALSGSMYGGTIGITAGGLPGEQQVSLSPAAAFTVDSPRRRAYLVSGPVTFLCDEAAGTLRRYSGYTIAASQAARDTAAELTTAGASVRLIARNITACDFTIAPGSATAYQIVTARITATRNGQSLQRVDQAFVENLP